MDFPRDLRVHPRPFKQRPEPPEPGESKQIGWYRVVARQAAPDEPIRYFLFNVDGTAGIDGKGLLAGGRDWNRFCHVRGWYPDPESMERKPSCESISSPAASSAPPEKSDSEPVSSARSTASPPSTATSPKPSKTRSRGSSEPSTTSKTVGAQVALFGSDPE